MSACRVHEDVVGGVHAARRRPDQRHHTVVDPRQVYNLDPTVALVDVIGELIVNGDITPQRQRIRHIRHDNGVAGIGEVHESRSTGQTHDCVFTAERRDVGHDVVRAARVTRELLRGDPAEQSHAGRLESAYRKSRSRWAGEIERFRSYRVRRHRFGVRCPPRGGRSHQQNMQSRRLTPTHHGTPPASCGKATLWPLGPAPRAAHAPYRVHVITNPAYALLFFVCLFPDHNLRRIVWIHRSITDAEAMAVKNSHQSFHRHFAQPARVARFGLARADAGTGANHWNMR